MSAVIADVNWLLSALAQASAAMIAIVGGLLVSRYVALHAEQQAAGRRVGDLARREQETSSRQVEAQLALDEYDADQLLIDDDVFQLILDKRFVPTVDEVLKTVDADGAKLNKKVLASRLAALSTDMDRALKELTSLVPEGKDHADWSEFRRSNTLTIGNRDVWEWTYEQICDFRRQNAKAREAEARKRTPYGALFGGSDIDFDALRRIPFAGSTPLIASQQGLARREVLRATLDQAEAESRALQQERRLAQETYEATRQPEGFGLALQVLTTLAVLGMAVPVVVMGFAPVDLPAWLRWTVIACFSVGSALLLRFLFVYASFLREGGRDKLPTSVLGLLKRP